MNDTTETENGTAFEGWDAETIYLSRERKGVSHYSVRGPAGLVATHIPDKETASRISAVPLLLRLASATAGTISADGEINAHLSPFSTRDLRSLADRALSKAGARAAARKSVRVFVPRPGEDRVNALVTAELYSREEIEAYAGDPADAPGSLNSYEAEYERQGRHAAGPRVLLELLTGACTHYFIHSPDAKRARDYAGGDFNVGDLSSELGSADLERAMRLHGIASFEIDDRFEASDCWVYDTRLVNGLELPAGEEGDEGTNE